ncbi:NAD(P)-binding domain-containing protein [Streptomyces sp. NBC_00988]|uniref:NAD(P)-dependent oxidoreductase n=1 Tax=Streptomyces sp. NBC_00988 TaxID=2903704 RepID=UPI0038705C6C|nr:NAD(P)-binding domain-containing protein [Streptomyces sp. NBC_00988]
MDRAVTATRVSVLGMGLMGSAVAKAFLDAGHDVAVWNRTPAKCVALADQGARTVWTPSEAVAWGEVTVAVLSDYRAVEEVVTSVAPGCAAAGTVFLNLTTGDAAAAADMEKAFASTGMTYLDGAVLAYPKDVGTTADILVSGPEAAWHRYRDVLAAMGAGTVHTSEAIHEANVIDTAATGSFFCTALGAFYEASAYASHHGVPADRLAVHALRWLDLLRTEILGGAQQIQSGSYKTDQAAVDTYEAAMAMITDTIRAIGQPAHIGAGFLANLRAAQAAGLGDRSLAVTHEVLGRAG